MKVNSVTERIASGVKNVQTRVKSVVKNMDKKEKLIFGLTALGVLGAASVAIARHRHDNPITSPKAASLDDEPEIYEASPSFETIFDRADDIKDEAAITKQETDEKLIETKVLADSFENGTHHLELGYSILLQGGEFSDRVMLERDKAEGFARKTVFDKKGEVKSIEELSNGEMTEIKTAPNSKGTYTVKKGVSTDGDTKKYDSIFYFVDGKFRTYKEDAVSNADERNFKKVYDFTGDKLTYTENVTYKKANKSLAYSKSLSFDKNQEFKDCIINFEKEGSKQAHFQRVFE